MEIQKTPPPILPLSGEPRPFTPRGAVPAVVGLAVRGQNDLLLLAFFLMADVKAIIPLVTANTAVAPKAA